jgi:diamine N-acetyltransferase
VSRATNELRENPVACQSWLGRAAMHVRAPPAWRRPAARRSLPRMNVELREITSETVRAICELEVAADQRSVVAPNAVSIAEAHFTPGHWMRAIYADGQPVGFVLTFDDPSEGYFLWRFMIAEGHQRRGIGRRAMQQVLEHWRELGVTAARTSVVPSNTSATRLYESLGFRLTGEEDDGELVMSLDM